MNGIQPADVAGMLAFEREILDIACDELEFITPIEKTHLEVLKFDRNVCAHPTFSVDGNQFTPSPELTRAYIIQAANYLLINAPMKGKVVVDRLFHLVNEESFPEDDEKAFLMLSSERYLGRVKESSVKNLNIILLKRLFRDEEGVNPERLNRICAALGAISRIHPAIYTEVLKSKLSQMLAESNDKLLKRVFPLLVRRSESWHYIEGALVVRLEGVVSLLSVEELISYKLADLASVNSEIDFAFQTRIGQLEDADIRKLLKASPSKVLRRNALTIFINSGSFASAYSNGTHYLVPHASYLTDDDMKVLFEGVLANGQWGINQIMNAGGIDEVFCQTYQDSKKNVGNHSQIWKGFWDTALEEGYSYDELRKLLIEDGLVEPVHTEVEAASENEL